MPLDVGRVTHLTDKMHRAEASNGTAIASNWIVSTDGTKATTWRPESASAVSYASNSNDVGNPSAAGASALVSRADHVHRGVRTVTSNGSNGLFADVNLSAGTGIALGVTGQAITITNTGSSGGGASVSYGSNATDVSDSSAAGASTLVSAADHRHKGVHSVTANGSNALYGDVNLKAGTGIALGVTGQDVTLTNTGASGGGSSNRTFFGGLPSGALQRSYTFASTVESWTTTAGTLSATGGRLRLVHTGPAVGLEPAGAANVADGELELDFDTTTMTGSTAICFRVTDSSNFYALIFQPAQGPDFFKNVGGTFTTIGTNGYTGIDLRRSVIQVIRVLIRFNGSHLEAYFNGTLVVATTDTTYTTGRIGIRADNATMEIDNVRVFGTPDLTTGNVNVP